MISERVFSRHYSSFWDELLPFADRFIRVINVSYERYEFAPEFDGHADADIRAFINELAFELYALLQQHAQRNEFIDLLKIDTSELEKLVAQRIAALSSTTINATSFFSPAVKQEASTVAGSIKRFFDEYYPKSAITLKPKFIGCGFVDTCFGDCLADSDLLEIKAGDRNFRSTDIKQVLVYAALNSVKQDRQITNVVLLNPRRGVFYRTSLHALCVESSAQGSSAILGQIINFISGTNVSK